jgi:N-acylneuraminate cytidylyltransferase
VDACIRKLQAGNTDLVLTVTPARRHPMFNMVTIDEEGLVRIASPSATPIHRRQEAPPMFDVCTVAYAATPTFVLGEEELLSGRTRAILVPPERSVDIDTEFDFLLAEFIAHHQKEFSS